MTVNPKATRQNPSFAGLLKRAACGLFGLLLLPGCSTDYLTDGVVTITIGQEPDAWSQEPAAKDLQLEMIQGTTRTTLANVAAPVTNISIGTGGPQSAIASFDATAFDIGEINERLAVIKT